MEPGLIWILAGLLLLGAELLLPGVFLLWVGVAAIGAGAFVLWATPEFGTTIAVFLALLAGGIAVAVWSRRGRTPNAMALNTPEAGLVGRAGLLLPDGAPGLRVRIGDSDWPARLPRNLRVPEGSIRVRVEAVEGNTLVVRPEGHEP